MCRLFGMHAGPAPTSATFWLLGAPNNLRRQSHYEPDGTGIGTFTEAGLPLVSKQPISAWHDETFAYEAKHLVGNTFIAHVRFASTGERTTENTHPFEQDGRLFAHNGVIHGLGKLDARIQLQGGSGLVLGQTDSERIFALITAEIRRAEGDVLAGLSAALGWIAANLPVYSLNLILVSPTDLWAFRYPETHELYVLDLPEGRQGSPRVHSERIRAHVPSLFGGRSVMIATEKMNDDPGWRLMLPGELIHVDGSMTTTSVFPLPQVPAYPLTLAQLDPKAAASQHPLPVH